MRRTNFVLALICSTVALVFFALPAAAHFCAFPASIKPDEQETINVGVASETTSAVDVVVRIPKGFRVDRIVDVGLWTGVSEGKTVRFTGGSIQPFECGYFAITGVADRKQTLVFPLTVTDNKGTVFEYTDRTFGNQFAAQIVYVRTDRSDPTVTGDTDGSALGPTVGVALAAVGALGLALIIGRFGLRRLRNTS